MYILKIIREDFVSMELGKNVIKIQRTIILRHKNTIESYRYILRNLPVIKQRKRGVGSSHWKI